MILKNSYFYFEKALTPKFCDEVIQHGSNNFQTALTGSITKNIKRDLTKHPLTQKELKELRKKRDSNISWLNDPWIFKEVIPYVKQANELAGWNFEWSISEHCQFTKYDSAQYYDWHTDSSEEPYNRPNAPEHNKIRKLSVTCTLSDPSEYEGGHLQFYFNKLDLKQKDRVKSCTEILPKGSIVVFPSFIWHRVTPVLSGTRYSLVIWNLGENFK